MVERKQRAIWDFLEIGEMSREAAELGYIRTMVNAHVRKLYSGNITEEGRKVLRELLKDLKQVEHMLEETK